MSDWLEATATYDGKAHPVWVNLRHIIGVVLREKTLYLEGESCNYEIDLPHGSHYAQGYAKNREWVDGIIKRIKEAQP